MFAGVKIDLKGDEGSKKDGRVSEEG